MYLPNSTAFSAVKKIDKRTVDRLSKFNIELAVVNVKRNLDSEGIFRSQGRSTEPGAGRGSKVPCGRLA